MKTVSMAYFHGARIRVYIFNNTARIEQTQGNAGTPNKKKTQFVSYLSNNVTTKCIITILVFRLKETTTHFVLKFSIRLVSEILL